jgi:hypothetical protein
MRSGYRLLATLVDILGIVSIVVECIILFIIPIISSVNYTSPYQSTFAVLIFGFTFDITTICLIISARFCHALEFQATYIIAWCTLGIGAGTLAGTCAFLSYVNPDSCHSYELRIVYMLYGN